MVTPYQAYLIDLDGTIYAGKKRYPAAKRFIERLQQTGSRFLFVTNNTTKLPSDVVANLAENHDIHVAPDTVYTAGLATADYLVQQVASRPRTAYVIGETGLKEAIQAKGFTLTAHQPQYVVVGLDSQVTYEKFATATLAIRAGGATFIGTNADSNIPNERGMLPGAGSLVKMVEFATQRQAIYIGKPQSIIMENALRLLALSPDKTIMVGDNYQTDIRAGMAVGMDTLLVYTGLSTPEEVKQQAVPPTFAIQSLDDWDLERGPIA